MSANLFWMLQRLGLSWVTTLSAQPGLVDQWQLHIASDSRWDETFSFTYRGSLASVITRAYEGASDDGDVEVAA